MDARSTPAPLAVERQERMLAAVAAGRTVRIADLAAALAVSPMTVRRDADALVARGALERVRGGVRTRRAPAAVEPEPSAKALLHRDAKERIAAAAADLVRPGMAVGIGGGTTALAVARRIASVEDLTIVTNSIPVLAACGEDATVVLTGGERTRSDALVGPIANRAARDVSLDLLVLGAHGIDEERGCTSPNLQEAETNRALASAARTVVVVADASKWHELGLASFLELDEVGVLVTDKGLPPEARSRTARRVGTLRLA